MNQPLEEDREYLLRSLADLEREHDAGDLADADYLALKEDYTARAAEVLRALGTAGSGTSADSSSADGGSASTTAAVVGRDGRGELAGTGVPAGAGRGSGTGDADAGGSTVGPRASKTTAPPRGGVAVATAPPRRSPWRSVAVGAVLLLVAGGAGLAVARSAGERTPGDPATGSIAATGPSAGIAADLAEARELIGAGRTLDAIKLFDQILEKDPEQPEALAYRGWLLRLAGKSAGNTELIDKGMEYIERAVAADPSYPDARFFRGFVLYQDRNDPAAAIPELRAFLAGDPPEGMVPVVEDLLSRAVAETQGASPAPAEAAPATTAPPG